MTNGAPQQTYGQYKIRKLSWNKRGSVYGISIPRDIAVRYLGVKFNIDASGDCLILKSGLDLVKLKEDMQEDIIEW